MKRLTPIEWGRIRERTTTLSLPDRGPEAMAKATTWLEKRQGSGWFYVVGGMISFGLATDAEAFKRWLVAETTA